MTTATTATTATTIRVPEDCGSEAELRSGLEQLLGEQAAWTEPLHIEIERREPDGMFELRLALGADERRLQDSDCQTLFRSALVILAAASGLTLPESQARSDQPQRRAPGDNAGTPSPWTFEVACGAGAVVGFVPELGARVDLQLAIENHTFGVQLGAQYSLPRSTDHDESPGARVQGYGLRTAALIVPWQPLRFSAGAELDQLHASSLGAARPGTGHAWSVAALLEASVRVLRVGDAHLDFAVAGQWALVRPQFEVVGFGPVYRLPRFGGALMARLGWSIF